MSIGNIHPIAKSSPLSQWSAPSHRSKQNHEHTQSKGAQVESRILPGAPSLEPKREVGSSHGQLDVSNDVFPYMYQKCIEHLIKNLVRRFLLKLMLSNMLKANRTFGRILNLYNYYLPPYKYLDVSNNHIVTLNGLHIRNQKE